MAVVSDGGKPEAGVAPSTPQAPSFHADDDGGPGVPFPASERPAVLHGGDGVGGSDGDGHCRRGSDGDDDVLGDSDPGRGKARPWRVEEAGGVGVPFPDSLGLDDERSDGGEELK